MELRHHEHHVQCLAFSPAPVSLDGGGGGEAGGGGGRLLLASGGRDSVVCVWDVGHGTLLFALRDHANWVNDLCFAPSGGVILSCADDRSIKVPARAAAGGKGRYHHRHHRSILSRQSHFLASVAPLP